MFDKTDERRTRKFSLRFSEPEYKNLEKAVIIKNKNMPEGIQITPAWLVRHATNKLVNETLKNK